MSWRARPSVSTASVMPSQSNCAAQPTTSAPSAGYDQARIRRSSPPEVATEPAARPMTIMVTMSWLLAPP
jgi:hypothetical protein